MDKVLELKTQVNNYIIDVLNEDNFKKNIKELIINESKNTIILKKENFFEGENYRIVRNSIKINLYKALKAQSFRDGLNSFIDNNLKSLESSNKTIEKVIPPAVTNGIKVYVYNHKDELVSSVKKLLSTESIEKKINEEVNNVLNGINPMVSRFISANTIYTRLKTGIEDYLNNPKNILDIVNMINSQIDGLMKKRISEFTSYFPVESRTSLINSVSKGIMDNILSEKFIDMAIDKLEEVINAALSSIDEPFSAFDNIISDFVDSFYDQVLNSEKIKDLVKLLSDNIVERLLNKPLISFIEA
jgi:hypothetical protein